MNKPDYRTTVFLPRTDFPMKAGLPEKEPLILAHWQATDLYAQLRAARAGKPKWILHDGPPYANGDMHIGHALNHTLKDLVVRTHSLLGFDAPYVPGWDCHGLPIEWKVEEKYRARKLNKDEVPKPEFRAECRAYAQGWVDVQAGQLTRLGINGDWKKPYLTMDFAAEATIVAELLKFAESGQLYRGAKPVMWSPVEKTALAEAEVEYEDVTSTQIDVAFQIVECPGAPKLVGAFAVVWTTTPWTIPVNQAIAFNPSLGKEGFYQQAYVVVRNEVGRRFLLCRELIESFAARTGFVLTEETLVTPEALATATARHPMHHLGGFFAKPRPFLPGEFVTTDAGTGLVHMSPDHGEDDFALCKANGIAPVFAVEADGRYRADWPWLGATGNVINEKFNAPDGPICSDLRDAGALLSASPFKHSYPHSWRSKKRVIYRCTPQWFIPMDTRLLALSADARADLRWEGEGGATTPDDVTAPGTRLTLRETALQAIAETRFIPEKGRNRIGAMVADRPDWVISRQRAWGVPITLFVDRKSGEYLKDPAINARIIAAVREHGVDAWTPELAQTLLGDRADDYEQVTDILDVWFDSGCTHAFVLESGRWPELQWPADLYLEGSDQHRGWFQSSLMESCGTRGRAPYKAVLTHGFTMDQSGRKMSKSLGNTIDPLVLMKDYGADILRLWAATVDFTEDHRIGAEILKGVADQYRKLRNSFRYLLGALDGFDEAERLPAAAMPELERWVLHRLAEIDAALRANIADFDFNAYVATLSTFVNNDLSAFVFDIRKDSLYCDAATSPRRRAYRTVLDTLFHALTRWLSPVLVFTAEEVWGTRYPDGGSVHLLEWPAIDAGWRDDALATRFERLRALRSAVTEAIEPLRRSKTVGSGLEAAVTLTTTAEDRVALEGLDFAELCITADIEIVHGETTGAQITATTDPRCERCWRHLPDVTEASGLCGRCETVVAA
ncbi:isoleucyl-tRNA synthetase [Polymorphobacter multimanifer]|uniref:Isoleucine--tRNA ligase n=1 Tax=Polymorphobacter multimanifer TaxID=1070431 RepID=A0A841L6L6_9SPHN|nr:isoleucine--tRNA ligase [Polymorphobacter multimanifer]MBB6228244.1 isoleucyl-tRNA synthetase [Polymorphobacter multimanifer]